MGGGGMMGEGMLSGCVRWPIYNGLNIVILESGNKYFTEIFAEMAERNSEDKCLWGN